MVSKHERLDDFGYPIWYLWKPRHVQAAIEYTLFGQGDFVLPD